MYTCDDLRELLWDYLYDLLEPEQSQAVRDHLAQCLPCRGCLEHAEAEQHLLAHAARLEEPVPVFQAPEPEPEPETVPATLPLPAPVTTARAVDRKAYRPRLWPWAAAAAAVFLAAGTGFGLYQRGVTERQNAQAVAEARLDENSRERAEAARRAEQEQAQFKSELRRSHLRVEVLGPASYQPGVASQYRVRTKYLDDNAAPAQVTARVLDAARNQPLVETEQLASHGDVLLQLPAASAATLPQAARLEVVAQNQHDREQVEELLHIQEPVYATHLAIDKPLYRPGEIVFFRSVTLDSFQKKPPEKPIALLYTLSDPHGRLVYQVGGPTRAGGIGGGEFALTDKLVDGEYTLQVAEAEGRFAPETRKLLVFRGQPVEDKKSAKGAVNAKPDVEFFPEGGSLVAEVPNRVYFGVRMPPNQAPKLKGRVVDSQGREVAAAQTESGALQPAQHLGLGCFTFTPRRGETYQLQVASPAVIPAPLPLPPVEDKGLALTVPAGVTREGEPIRAVLFTTDQERALIVGAYWRDRLVAQEAITAKPPKTEVRLNPGPGVGGVLRLTVFEQERKQLRPLAERLIYRQPAERLVLSAEADRKRYRPGEPVNLTVRSATEKNAPSPGWMLVSVVDKQAVAGLDGAAAPSLPAYFLLTGQLQHPEDLERADLLLNDTPQAAAALDLFLGTQGWRRFAGPAEQEVILAKGTGGPQRGQAAGEGESPVALLKLDNSSRVHDKYSVAWAKESARLRQVSAAREHTLEEERSRRAAAVTAAASALRSYQKRAGDYLRLGAGLAVLGLLVLGCGALGIGLVRFAIGRTANTAYFATAFTALLICVVAFLAFTEQSPDTLVQGEREPGRESSTNRVAENPTPKATAREGNSLESSKKVLPLDDQERSVDTRKKEVPAFGKDKKLGGDFDQPAKKPGHGLDKATDEKAGGRSVGNGQGLPPAKDVLRAPRSDPAGVLPGGAPAPGSTGRTMEDADRDRTSNLLHLLLESRADRLEMQRKLQSMKEVRPEASLSAAAPMEQRFREAEEWARLNRAVTEPFYRKTVSAEATKSPPAAGGIKWEKGEGKGPDLQRWQYGAELLPVQTYAHVYPKQFAAHGGDFQETVLWHPILQVGADGKAQVPPFQLSDSAASFRVLIYGHSPSGRLGVFNGTLEAQPRR
jgi:hypothetical protein